LPCGLACRTIGRLPRSFPIGIVPPARASQLPTSLRRRGRRRVIAAGWLAVSLTIVGCSSATAPRQPPTILITNAVCAVGPCRTLLIKAFVWAFEVPQPPSGFEIVGFVRGPATCLTFPAKWTLKVGTPGGVPTTLTWTPTSPSGIFLTAIDSVIGFGGGTTAQLDSANAGLWPYAGPGGSVGISPTFVPGNAAGWSISFPATTPSGAPTPALTATSACTT